MNQKTKTPSTDIKWIYIIILAVILYLFLKSSTVFSPIILVVGNAKIQSTISFGYDKNTQKSLQRPQYNKSQWRNSP